MQGQDELGVGRQLMMAASNGDAIMVRNLLQHHPRSVIDVDQIDEDGSAPLIYASCFGHLETVIELLNAGANVDQYDKNLWTALMWATTNHHVEIAKLLLDHGASLETKTGTGRTAWDFISLDPDISQFVSTHGYPMGTVGVTGDYYDGGFSQDRLEDDVAEQDMKRRLLMESAANLEVDLASLGLNENLDWPDAEEDEEAQPFVWDRCLNDQMLVFQESELEDLLNTVITNMIPQRSPSQKPVPANVLFLASRYAHYYANQELLDRLLTAAMDRISEVIERHQWDMTILAFWIANTTLLLHYIQKDSRVLSATAHFQPQLIDLINEIFVLIIRDAERRIDRIFDAAMLDYEPIVGFEDIRFQNEWRLFRSKPKMKPPEPAERGYRPPLPQARAKPAPQSVTSLLSSTLFVLDLYDVHPNLIVQIMAQLFYWIGAEIFNRVMASRQYLARTKAMQVRMNISALEDWARNNDRKTEHLGDGTLNSPTPASYDAARQHLSPPSQLLQWLQCFSHIGDDREMLITTVHQLPRLTPEQLLHSANRYRLEIGEKGLSKSAKATLFKMMQEYHDARARRPGSSPRSKRAKNHTQDSSSPDSVRANGRALSGRGDDSSAAENDDDSEEEGGASRKLLMDPALMLPFSLPTSGEMFIQYGSQRSRSSASELRKYTPTVPPEFLARLDQRGQSRALPDFEDTGWAD